MSNDSVSPAFVTGTTGYVGQYVVRQLTEQGVPTVTHIRPDSKRLSEWRECFESQSAQVDTTKWNADVMAETFRRLQPSVVFCLIGTTRHRITDYRKEGRDAAEASYEAIDYGLTALLVDAAKRADIEPRFIYLSAMGTSPKAKGGYMRARYKAEQAVIASGLPYTIVRPAIIAGPDREESRMAEQWGGKFLDGILTFAVALGIQSAAKYRSINGEALANLLVKVTMDAEYENRIVKRHEFR